MVAQEPVRETFDRLSGSLLALHDIVSDLLKTLPERCVTDALRSAIAELPGRADLLPPDLAPHYRNELLSLEEAVHGERADARDLLRALKTATDSAAFDR